MLTARTILVVLALPAAAGCTHEPYAEREIVLCYRTLADISCYDRPDPGRDGRLVGFYLREPADPRRPATALAVAKARIEEPD